MSNVNTRKQLSDKNHNHISLETNPINRLDIRSIESVSLSSGSRSSQLQIQLEEANRIIEQLKQQNRELQTENLGQKDQINVLTINQQETSTQLDTIGPSKRFFSQNHFSYLSLPIPSYSENYVSGNNSEQAKKSNQIAKIITFDDQEKQNDDKQSLQGLFEQLKGFYLNKDQIQITEIRETAACQSQKENVNTNEKTSTDNSSNIHSVLKMHREHFGLFDVQKLYNDGFLKTAFDSEDKIVPVTSFDRKEKLNKFSFKGQNSPNNDDSIIVVSPGSGHQSFYEGNLNGYGRYSIIQNDKSGTIDQKHGLFIRDEFGTPKLICQLSYPPIEADFSKAIQSQKWLKELNVRNKYKINCQPSVFSFFR